MLACSSPHRRQPYTFQAALSMSNGARWVVTEVDLCRNLAWQRSPVYQIKVPTKIARGVNT
jgi:hypothetical protein